VFEQAHGIRKWSSWPIKRYKSVAPGKSLRLVRAPRPLEYLDYDLLGFADAGYGALKAK